MERKEEDIILEVAREEERVVRVGLIILKSEWRLELSVFYVKDQRKIAESFYSFINTAARHRFNFIHYLSYGFLAYRRSS
jgi:hypothetical protein